MERCDHKLHFLRGHSYFFREDVDTLERVQRSATKLIHGLENKLCDISLKELNLDYQRESGEVS